MATLSRPSLSKEVIGQIASVMEAHPDWGRTKVSKHLCTLWDWRSSEGQLKDISCRDMLRKLDRDGAIRLPEPKRLLKVNERRTISCKAHDSTPLAAPLSHLQPLSIHPAHSKDERDMLYGLIASYHYLGYERSVGESMGYMVYGSDGKQLACMLFGSAAWALKGRDDWIGWDRAGRTRHLGLLTNNTRFLILPWISTKNLASHVLSLVSRRISTDWQEKYGHPLYLLETFVERDRFVGTCYRAAGWQLVGTTCGRGRNDRKKEAALPQKDIYLNPLVTDFRKSLGVCT